MNAPRSGWTRGLLLLLLAVGVLGFGAMSLCGAFWTVQFLPLVFTLEGVDAVAFLALSLPCLTGGFFLARRCLRAIRRLLQPPTQEEPLP